MPGADSNQPLSVSRRLFVHTGLTATAAGLSARSSTARDEPSSPAIADPEPWLTAQEDFRDVSRGKPVPHSLPEDQRRTAGLTRDTWRLNVISDKEFPATIRQPLTGDQALTFRDLMQLAETHAVRFPKVMTCLNIGCPLGMGLWEGVPLREVLWKTQPVENLRRVFYYGFHNDEPKQMFRSSLPVGRILEDPFGLPPVILCYKLNGHWLTPERGGPVRMVVPESYGFKNIKWLTNVVLSNRATANDTYAEQNNDIDSPLKTFCATINPPADVTAGQPIPLTGYAQVGISGLDRVQVWIHNRDESLPDDDPMFTTAPWQDAAILPPPADWGGRLPENSIPAGTFGFTADRKPASWPLPLSKVFWRLEHPGLPAGRYSLRCRTIDSNGAAQPMPRPFRKSGHAKIEHIRFDVV